MTQMEHIRNELDKADALLTAAADLIKDGRIVSISSLKGIIDNVCRLINEEGYAHCLTLKPVLTRLSERMDQLRAIMEKQLKKDDSPLAKG